MSDKTEEFEDDCEQCEFKRVADQMGKRIDELEGANRYLLELGDKAACSSEEEIANLRARAEKAETACYHYVTELEQMQAKLTRALEVLTDIQAVPLDLSDGNTEGLLHLLAMRARNAIKEIKES
jgi:hypothetical protein